MAANLPEAERIEHVAQSRDAGPVPIQAMLVQFEQIGFDLGSSIAEASQSYE